MKKLKECPCCGSRTVSHVNFGAAHHTVMCDTNEAFMLINKLFMLRKQTIYVNK
jgi:hypothetical protein